MHRARLCYFAEQVGEGRDVAFEAQVRGAGADEGGASKRCTPPLVPESPTRMLPNACNFSDDTSVVPMPTVPTWLIRIRSLTIVVPFEAEGAVVPMPTLPLAVTCNCSAFARD
jgi:hypothetical protein